MTKIEFPKPLKDLLEDSDLQAPIRAFADRVGEILADNKLPFFPDYTDHGANHINCVLKSEVELIPKHVWEQSKKYSDPHLLCNADAAVIIGATLLHDIAMHLRPDGFLELVSKDSRFQPLPWFMENQEDHAADLPWHDLWNEYAREARRFSDKKLADIVGQESVRHGWKFHELPEDVGQWELNHFLIIGEFIRRHHARLAHEIAIYGFPGLSVGGGAGQFPSMGKEQGHPLMRLADLIGLAARSHGTTLRVCKTYIESSPLYIGTPRPMGTAVLYAMALLRVADYLQIDRQRAPAVLLQLRNPQSPISVQEWNKHLAVQNISPANDPRGKMVTVSNNIKLELYLQLKDLLAGLQKEMDHSTAVLDEAYGTRTDLGLHQLNLSIRRVYSNLYSSAFRDSLPYVPERTGFSADPNLLALLVEPLYGKEPGVGVRELMQNAVDAVRELTTWCETHGKSASSLDLPAQEADVLIDFIKRDNGTWFLRIRDKGIGMTGDTLHKYFLRAGASFRQSADWAQEFLDANGQPRVLRSGRFGVGAFAAFLLGPTFKIQTRHVNAPKAMCYELEASRDSQLIEIRRTDGLPVGTTLEVELSSETVKALECDKEKYEKYSDIRRKTDWFCWDAPKIVRRVLRGSAPEILEQEYNAVLRQGKPELEWSLIRPAGFDAVFWTFTEAPDLVCNGIKIAGMHMTGAKIGWELKEMQLTAPKLSVFDSAANLPLTTQRYNLSQEAVPFINELARDVILSFIAHALVCGPSSHAEALSTHARHPLSFQPISDVSHSSDEALSIGYLRWCATPNGEVPADPWLYSLLGETACLVYGAIVREEWRSSPYIPQLDLALLPASKSACAMVNWHISFDRSYYDDNDDYLRQVAKESNDILEELVRHGIKALGHQAPASNIVVLSNHEFDLEACHESYDFFQQDDEANLIEWRKTSKPHAAWQRFEAQHGSLVSPIALESLIDAIEYAAENDTSDDDPPEILFIAEIQTTPASCSPETLLAKIWNECLGLQAIPFDLDARKALIDHGRQHHELKRHIEAWEEMKRTNSMWANYPHDERFRKN